MSNVYSRLSTANAYDNSVRNIGMRQSNLSNLQENLTSGKRVVRTSDDPTSAAIAERSLTRISRIAADQRALESQRNAIALAESTLGDITDNLQSFRELVVSAGNGGHSNAERQAIAFQLSGLRDSIVAAANLKDTNGQPLFGAMGSATTLISGPQATSPDYTFNGLPGQQASTGISIPIALDGDSAFMLHPTRDQAFNAVVNASSTLSISGVTVSNTATVSATEAATLAATGRVNSFPDYTLAFTAVDTSVPGTTTATYTVTENPSVSGALGPVTVSYPSNQAMPVTAIPGLSVSISGTPTLGDTVSVSASPSLFSVLDNAIKDIGTATTHNAASQAVAQTLTNLDIGMQRISGVRGQAGDLLTRADRITSNQDKRSVQLEADRSRAEDLDMIKGISDFNNQQTGYQAALQTYAQIQKLSLFNFIG
ncbi:MAG: flagellar hook-associated protein FlgL [Rhodoferax sp.]|nr:flagellar hook-associated protein FlgL [Rhodoferax sp.]